MPPGGRVLFVSSSLTHASTITPNYVVYAASKAAVEQFTRTLAKDLAHLGINVNTFSPGPTDTPLFREGKSESLMNWFANLSPFGRLGTSEDIQGVVSFLVGPDSKWVSGQNIRVNGGFAV
jgi:3-oxoacyl-[acyl-carrier protein] reductase